MDNNTFDVIVIGSGPGGYVTAIRAAQLGMKAAIIEREALGGICLNWGCIPTKALLRSADVLRTMREAKAFGLHCDKPSADFDAVIKRSRAVSKRLSQGVQFLMKKNKITVIKGSAKLQGGGKIQVEGQDGGIFTAPHIIIATGARPRALPGIEPDKRLIWTYFEALAPDTCPKRLLIMGSGAIGMEFASFYNTMGANVTIVEVMDQVLPVEDAEIAKTVHKHFEADGINIRTGTKITRVTRHENSLTAVLEKADGQSETIEADRMISAVGVVGNIENLGLEALGIKTDKGCIVTNGFGQTSVQGIYAIGDVAGPPMLAHKAEHEGVICVEAIKGLDVHPMDKASIPGCTYCHPQVASIGLTEAQAQAKGINIKVGRFPLTANGKAVALGETSGMVKTIFDASSGALIGAHLVGAEVTEMIQGFVIAMQLETTEESLMHTVFPHPTVSESMHESVLDAFDRVIHA